MCNTSFPRVFKLSPWFFHCNHFKFPVHQLGPLTSTKPDSPSNTVPRELFLSPEMAMSAAALNLEKFYPFQIHSTSYEVVNEHPIGVDVLVPKKLEPGTKKCPLIVRFHGRFLVSNLTALRCHHCKYEVRSLFTYTYSTGDWRLTPSSFLHKLDPQTRPPQRCYHRLRRLPSHA